MIAWWKWNCSLQQVLSGNNTKWSASVGNVACFIVNCGLFCSLRLLHFVLLTAVKMPLSVTSDVTSDVLAVAIQTRILAATRRISQQESVLTAWCWTEPQSRRPYRWPLDESPDLCLVQQLSRQNWVHYNNNYQKPSRWLFKIKNKTYYQVRSLWQQCRGWHDKNVTVS